MSLRTKLLATAIGLPLSILLIALALVRDADRREYATAQAVMTLFERGQRSTWREFGRAILDELDGGVLQQAWVFRWAREDTEESMDELWTARVFFSEETGRLTEPDLDPLSHSALYERVRSQAVALVNDSRSGLVSFEHAAIDEAPRHLTPPRAEWVATYRLHGDDLTILPSDLSRGRRFAVVAETRRRGSLVQHLYVVLAAGILALGILGWFAVSRWVIRPMERLASAADALAEGRRLDPLPVRNGRLDELGRTTDAFNRMAREIRAYQEHLQDRIAEGLETIRRTEQHLAIAQRLAATGKLAAGLAHEINNPLGGLRNAVRSLSRGDLAPDRQAVYLDLLDEGLDRIEHIVKRFLAFTPRSAQARRTDVVEVVERGIAMASHRLVQAKVDVRTRLLDHGEAIVFGDPVELQQVVLNLLLNAADALDGRDAPRWVEVSVDHDADRQVVLRVKDSGPGIPPEDQARCFDMFFTTKGVGEGSGMGLAVAHSIVTNHGGSIDLSSPPGEGATFTVRLPRASDGASDDPVTPA